MTLDGCGHRAEPAVSVCLCVAARRSPLAARRLLPAAAKRQAAASRLQRNAPTRAALHGHGSVPLSVAFRSLEERGSGAALARKTRSAKPTLGQTHSTRLQSAAFSFLGARLKLHSHRAQLKSAPSGAPQALVPLDDRQGASQQIGSPRYARLSRHLKL